ncbi:MAG: hypothetical protein ACRD2A_09980, partial [Vicinamibacterales bacterium]
PYIAVASSGRHDSDLNPRWSTIARYIDHEDKAFHEGVTHTRSAHRLSKEVDAHGLRYGDGARFIEPNFAINHWIVTKKYQKYGLYTTDSDMGHLFFVIDRHGNLIRRWDRDDGTHTVTIDSAGKVACILPTPTGASTT